MRSIVIGSNCILFDWLSFTSVYDSVEDLKKLLGLEHVNWQQCQTSFNGYMYRISFDYISICWGVPPKAGNNYDGDFHKDTVYVSMSGQGCRAFETYSTYKDFNALFSVLLADPENYNITRLDVAYDDFTGKLDLSNIIDQVRFYNICTRYTKAKVYEGLLDDKNNDTLNIGSKQSEVFMRVYNKAAERNRTEEIKHWIRWELQMRRSRAVEFLRKYHELGCNIGKTFTGVLLNYIRFVTPSETDSNKRRWKLQEWFEKFIAGAEKISIYSKKDVEYNVENLRRYVVNMAGNAVRSAIRIFGLTDYVTELYNSKSVMNPKYNMLVRQVKGDDYFDRVCAEEKDILSVLNRIEAEGLI